jgi:hypothetical protein
VWCTWVWVWVWVDAGRHGQTGGQVGRLLIHPFHADAGRSSVRLVRRPGMQASCGDLRPKSKDSLRPVLLERFILLLFFFNFKTGDVT